MDGAGAVASGGSGGGSPTRILSDNGGDSGDSQCCSKSAESVSDAARAATWMSLITKRP